MSFDYRKEFAKFKREWEKQEKIMRDEGMSEEAIAEFYNFSYKQFKGDRNYALKICDFTSIDSEEEKSKCKRLNKSMVEQSIEFDELFNGLMQTDNYSLLQGLQTLSKSELQVVILYCEKEMDLKQISIYLGQKYDATQKQFYRAKNKIKNFL